jgi:hypothetical protein
MFRFEKNDVWHRAIELFEQLCRMSPASVKDSGL